MKKILLLSDTHNFLDPQLLDFFSTHDEIWHAGDFGNITTTELLPFSKKLKGVYGNIDDKDTRLLFPEYLFFECEGVNILMIHIAGSSPKYNKKTKSLIQKYQPQVLICGHSHILKIGRVGKMLHINPGAAGRHGFHIERTALSFTCNQGKIEKMQLIKLGKRSTLENT